MKWGFKKAFICCALLLTAGAVFQFIFGGMDRSFLKQPWGAIIAINYLYLLILTYAKSDRWDWAKKLYDRYSMTASLAFMTLLCIILGLFNFRHATSSWPFCLIYLHFTTILGLRTIDDIHHWRKRRLVPLLSHAAVFLILAAGMFSSGDKIKVRITAPIGHPVHMGQSADGKEVQLPFSIVLKDFTMEEYAPKLHLIDYRQGTSSAEYISVEDKGLTGSLEGWEITVLDILENAGRMKDSLDYKAMDHVGAATAVYVRAIKTAAKDEHVQTSQVSAGGPSGTIREGWVSCGSHIFQPAMLQLDERHAIAMPSREPSKYLSEVIIIDQDGEKTRSIEVNKPAKIGAWRIYQQGYDTERGRWSTISIFECVRDGWYPFIQTALWMILASGLIMALTAGGSGRKKGLATRKEGWDGPIKKKETRS